MVLLLIIGYSKFFIFSKQMWTATGAALRDGSTFDADWNHAFGDLDKTLLSYYIPLFASTQ